ncbi:MAG: proline--tRNA ligase [Thainema sp.]
MRLSQMLFVTLREDPAEAEIPSHKLLVRAGYIRRIGSGVYSYLPLMWRVLKKVSKIVREEMDAAGAQECLLPQIQPAELWRESGRWDTYTQAEGIMFAITDRQQRELGLGPTHEEVITTIAKEMIRSYRQLPQNLYQIQTKFRDEIRPRFGLMRGREFIMKDAYSFDADEAGLEESYQKMYTAYCNILRRTGLAFRAVEADSGAIGGAKSQEFMVLAEAGEDEVLYTEDGQYAANVERAVSLPADAESSPFKKYEKLDTPNTPTIATLCEHLNCSPTNVVKNVLYDIQYLQSPFYIKLRAIVLVSIRGDQEVNEVKLQNKLISALQHPGIEGSVTVLKTEALSVDAQHWDAQQSEDLEPLPNGYLSPELDWTLYFDPKIKLETAEDLKKVFDLEEQGKANSLRKFIPEDKDLSNLNTAIEAWGTAIQRSRNLPNSEEELTKDSVLTGEKGLLRQLAQLQTLNNRGEAQIKFLRLVDETAVDLKDFATGSNETDSHVVGANWGAQFTLPDNVVDVRKAAAGDRAVHDQSQTLQTARGIEIGHIFQLGTKYSEAMGATYTNEQGEEKPLVMGCYGVGVSRLAQAAVEQSYDKDGIIWPVAIAPYHAVVVVPNISDENQMKTAEQIYNELNAAGVETLLDDRDERAGVKFKDADLVGIPFRIVTGRSLKDGKVEVVKRADHESQDVPVEEVVSLIKQWVDTALTS